MHYRHAFHAGNFADVFKHVLLCALLSSLNRKDKPWCFLDTHAGAGLYDLGEDSSQRTGEWRDGIGRLLQLDPVPAPLSAYLRIIRGFQSGEAAGGSVLYPGSPLIARACARQQDRLVLCERVPEVADELRAVLRDWRRLTPALHESQAEDEPPRNRPGDGLIKVALHLRDGYEAAALLPPDERRGLVLVDPPFERPDEFEAVAAFLETAVRRFAGGVYAAWYPLKNFPAAGRFARQAARRTQRPALDLRLDTDAPGEGQMRRCGLLLLNPPFGFAAEAQAVLEALAPLLAQGPRPAWTIEPVPAA
jgi:23S rRNA (adenine2030-N6)-methyltransferase